VGRKSSWRNDQWLILDVVTSEQSLVLQRLGRTHGPIQTDAFGNANRRAPETLVLEYLDESGEIAEEALELLAGVQS
jgi:hypothetical protein